LVLVSHCRCLAPGTQALSAQAALQQTVRLDKWWHSVAAALRHWASYILLGLDTQGSMVNVS
jgi:hypothetical protein